MKLSKKTQEVLKNFASINSNILIKEGKALSTMAVAKNIFASTDVEEEFEHEVGIFNLPEFLGVMGLFTDPDIKFSDKFMTLSEGKSKIKYVYADPSILVYPDKPVKAIDFQVEFEMGSELIIQLQKAAAVLGVQDVSIEGDGKKIVAKVLDKKSDSSNNYLIDLEAKTDSEFKFFFKVENFKFLTDSYTVSLSDKKISKWVGKDYKVTYYVAAEQDSEYTAD